MTGPAEHDLEVVLADAPGALAALAQALGRAGVSLEGGATFVADRCAVAHYLVADGEAARAAVLAADLGAVTLRRVVTARLDQQVPGQLGALTARVAAAGIDLRAQYSDHDGHLVLVVEAAARARLEDLVARWP